MVDVAAQQKVIQDTLHRIGGHKGVEGYMVLNPRSGALLHYHGFKDDKGTVEAYREKLHAFMQASHSVVRTLDHKDALTFLRMRWRQREIIIAPDHEHGEYVLIVVHVHQAAAAKTGAAEIAEATGASPTDKGPSAAMPATDAAAAPEA